MRFSIAKNFCPSCGSNLLSDAVFGEINAINKKLQSQEFMINLSGQLNKDLVQNLIYDLSIFFKFELEKVYRAEVGHSSTSEGFEEPSSRDESDRDDESSGGEAEQEKTKLVHKPVSRAQSLSEIRNEVKREVLSEIRSEDEDEDEGEDDDMDSSDEDVDDRVKRLKKLYDTSPTLKKVFKGVSRIE
jgi:hypothetical protein